MPNALQTLIPYVSKFCLFAFAAEMQSSNLVDLSILLKCQCLLEGFVVARRGMILQDARIQSQHFEYSRCRHTAAGKAIRLLLPSISSATLAASVESPHISRCSPSSQMSPTSVTGTFGTSGTSSGSVRPFFGSCGEAAPSESSIACSSAHSVSTSAKSEAKAAGSATAIAERGSRVASIFFSCSSVHLPTRTGTALTPFSMAIFRLASNQGRGFCWPERDRQPSLAFGGLLQHGIRIAR